MGISVCQADAKSNSVIKLDYLQWYWDIIGLSTDALAQQDFESYQFYEDWRRDIKGGVLA